MAAGAWACCALRRRLAVTLTMPSAKPKATLRKVGVLGRLFPAPKLSVVGCFSPRQFVLSKGRTWLAEVVSLGQGDGVTFAVRERPVQGRRGHDRMALRHGGSRIKSGERFTL